MQKIEFKVIQQSIKQKLKQSNHLLNRNLADLVLEQREANRFFNQNNFHFHKFLELI